MEHRDEIELVRNILDGETKAFSILVERYQGRLHSLIGRITGCREDAEELTQDVFIKAYTKLGTFRNGCSLSTWLHRIAYNTAISATRKKKLVYTDFDGLENIADGAVDEMLNREDDERLLLQIEQALAHLGPDDRALLELYYTQQKPVAEVAAITGLSEANVKIKLFRVRKKIVFLINSLS